MKTWQKPQLIVLVRSRPEEAILTACKAATFGTNPSEGWSGCATTDGYGCVSCSETTSS